MNRSICRVLPHAAPEASAAWPECTHQAPGERDAEFQFVVQLVQVLELVLIVKLVVLRPVVVVLVELAIV